MADQSIVPADRGEYFEGDALRVPFTVRQSRSHEPEDLSDADAEFLVKRDVTDPDEDAVLVLDTDEDSDDGGNVTITDGENGELAVKIATGDTDGILDATHDDEYEGDRYEDYEFVFVLRVTDSDDNRVTVARGTWTVHAG